MIDAVARQLYSEADYFNRFQAFSDAVKQQKLVQSLRAERHLLILDNLESITGHGLAIPHTLSESEQAKLQQFLDALLGGKTLVLLGSRDAKAWLQVDIYEVVGLDAESTSELVNVMLQRLQVTHYRESAELKQVVGWLAGHPRALEILLNKLSVETPKNLMEDLTARFTKRFPNENMDSIEGGTILFRVVHAEFLYHNLPDRTKNFLLHLVPFGRTIDLAILNEYLIDLKQFSILSDIFPEGVEYHMQILQRPPYDRLIKIMGGYLKYDSEFYDVLVIHYSKRDTKWRNVLELCFQQRYQEFCLKLSNMLKSEDTESLEDIKAIFQLHSGNLDKTFRANLSNCLSMSSTYIELFNQMGRITPEHIVLSNELFTLLDMIRKTHTEE